MNKHQWNSWGAIFFFLGIAFIIIETQFVGYQTPGTVIWAISRLYFLAIWIFFAIAFSCFFSSYYEGREKKKK